MARLSPVTRASLCLCAQMSPSSVGSMQTQTGPRRAVTHGEPSTFPVLTGEQGVRNVCPCVSQSARPRTPGFPFQSGWHSDFSHCSFAVKEPPPVFLYYKRTTANLCAWAQSQIPPLIGLHGWTSCPGLQRAQAGLGVGETLGTLGLVWTTFPVHLATVFRASLKSWLKMCMLNHRNLLFSKNR